MAAVDLEIVGRSLESQGAERLTLAALARVEALDEGSRRTTHAEAVGRRGRLSHRKRGILRSQQPSAA